MIVIPLIGGIALADVGSKNFPELETGKQTFRLVNKSNKSVPENQPPNQLLLPVNLDLETQIEPTVYSIIETKLQPLRFTKRCYPHPKESTKKLDTLVDNGSSPNHYPRNVKGGVS